MANRTPYFFLVPTWDFPPPPLGPIQLGSVITSVKTPERPLYRAPMPAEADVFSTEKRQISFSTDSLRAGRFGIFTRFLSAASGTSIDVGVGWDGSDTSFFTFDRLNTTQFLPKPSYIEAAIAAEPVRRYLDKSRYRKPIYIITGLKTVSGARAKSLRERAVGANVKAEVDGRIWGGVPLGGQPEIGGKKENREHMAWEGGSDFVFAFRVRKVLVERKTGMVRKEEEYKLGAILDGAVKGRDGPELRIVVEDEADAEEEGFMKEELMDGDEVVACAVPHVESDPEGDMK